MNAKRNVLEAQPWGHRAQPLAAQSAPLPSCSPPPALPLHRTAPQERYACKTILKSQLKRQVEVMDVKREVVILQVCSMRRAAWSRRLPAKHGGAEWMFRGSQRPTLAECLAPPWRASSLSPAPAPAPAAQMLSSHPNVAALLSSYEDATSVNLILELCEGGELFERIAARGSLTEHEAARYFTAMVQVRVVGATQG